MNRTLREFSWVLVGVVAVFTSIIFLWSLPFQSQAAGLVPCSGAPGDECQMCHVVQLVDNVSNWLIRVGTIVLVLLYIGAGLYLVTSQGNPSAKTSARRLLISATVGYVILAAIWTIMNLFMSLVLGGDEIQGYGPWRVISCTAQPLARVFHPTPGQSRGTATTTYTAQMFDPATGAIDPSRVSALALLSSPDAQVAAAATAAGLDAVQTRNLQALMRVESSGCRNVVSPVGALGCMQIMPNTARQYDPSLRGLSEAQVRERLLDNAYNIELGTRIYADLYRRYEGDTTRLFAGYNGGPGANAPSRDCPGLLRWQCEWDSPGCHGTGRTDCVRNTGYRETREYVQKVNAVATALAGS